MTKHKKNSYSEDLLSRREFRVEVIDGRRKLIVGDKATPFLRVENKIILKDFPYAGAFADLLEAAEFLASDPLVPVGQVPSLRKDFLDLDTEEREIFAAALNQLYANGYIHEAADIHDHGFSSDIHFLPQFLPWHRWLLYNIEQMMLRINPRAALPYWDWTRTEARDFDGNMLNDFFGGRTNQGGRFSHWDFTREEANLPVQFFIPSRFSVVNHLNQPDFSSFRGIETADAHNGAHTWVGGTMVEVNSPLDPLFYLHHCNIDRLWAIWQINHQDEEQYNTIQINGDNPVNFDSKACAEDQEMYTGGFGTAATPEDMLSHKSLGYRYPTDERLEEAWDGGEFIGGDRPEFIITPRSIRFLNVRSGTVDSRNIRLINDTDIAVNVHVTPQPAVLPNGPVNGIFWFELRTTIQPRSERRFFVAFSPKDRFRVYTDTVQIVVDQGGTPTNVSVNVFGQSSFGWPF